MGRKRHQIESNRKRQKLSTTQLEDLPVEVLIIVLNFLELPDLNRVGQVSKRLNSICHVESCWQKTILGSNTRPEKTTVPIQLVKKILNRGCRTLSLKRCKLTGGSYLHSKADEKLGSSQLINLDMYQCEFPNGFLETLLSSSHSLKTFSLMDHNINRFFFPYLSPLINTFYIQNGQTLQILNLAFTQVVSWKHIELIVKNCTGLKEVDFTDCSLSYKALRLLVNGITKNIEKIGLALCGAGRGGIDGYIKILVSRCNKIKSLNLAMSSSITNKSLTSIMENLKNTLEELDITCCGKITDTKLLEMRSMPKLKVLNYFKKWDPNNYEDLKKNLPQLTNYNPKKKWKGWQERLFMNYSYYEQRKLNSNF